MTISLLTPSYAAIFIDDQKYAGRPAIHLEGLACAIQDSNQTWRPSISELVALLPQSEKGNEIVAAGMAYGAAKRISSDFPGPAILLFGAALNTIGREPKVDLETAIDEAKKILNEHQLMDAVGIRDILNAAKENARFDKVSQMLRNEFSYGLKASTKYDDATISDVARKIVNVTHDVRHRGLIERIMWQKITITEGATTTDIGWLREIDDVIFTDDPLRELCEYAQVGCAYSILKRVDEIQKNQT